MASCFVVINATNQPPTVSIVSSAQDHAFPASSTMTFTWTMSDDLLYPAQLLVWANVTMNNATTPLLVASLGATSSVCAAPDLAMDRAVCYLLVGFSSGLRVL